MSRTLLLSSNLPGGEGFKRALQAQGLGLTIAESLAEVDPDSVEIAIIWLVVPDYLYLLPRLKLVLVCGSGIDHLAWPAPLPEHVQVIRMVDPFLRDQVAVYVLETIKGFIQEKGGTLPTVGLMGLGLVGDATANKLLQHGYKVCGWVRTPRPRGVAEIYVGKAELFDFARQSEVLVCMLPLTDQTQGILSGELFDHLPKGAMLVNVGRGAHLVDADLVPALESGRLSSVRLDVFTVEPMPIDHPFLFHPGITVTPHIAGRLMPEHQAAYAALLIAGIEQNEAPVGVVDFHADY